MHVIRPSSAGQVTLQASVTVGASRHPSPAVTLRRACLVETHERRECSRGQLFVSSSSGEWRIRLSVTGQRHQLPSDHHSRPSRAISLPSRPSSMLECVYFYFPIQREVNMFVSPHCSKRHTRRLRRFEAVSGDQLSWSPVLLCSDRLTRCGGYVTAQ